MFHTILQHFLLFNQLSHVPISGSILTRVFLHYLQTVSQVLDLILLLEEVPINGIDRLTLLLDGLTEGQVGLKDLLHHIHSVNDSLSDGIFRFIDRAMREGGLVVLDSDVVKGVALLFEELLNIILILDDTLGNDQLPLFTTLPVPPLGFSTGSRPKSLTIATTPWHLHVFEVLLDRLWVIPRKLR